MSRLQRQIADEDLFNVGAHQPTRPGWICEHDDEEFPCAAYREWVLETKAGIDRGMHMSPYFQMALGELRLGVPGAVWERFLGWTRESAPAPRGWHPPGGVL